MITSPLRRPRLRVLDLFAGLRGWSDPWAARGHETFTVDWDEKFEVDLHADVLSLTTSDLPERFQHPDVILASPPCEKFSVMRIGRNWHGPEGEPGCGCAMGSHGAHEPKTPEAATAVALVGATLRLIHLLEPRWWVMENPVGKLRKLPVVAWAERRTVTYCQVGEVLEKADGTIFRRQKPTDLWGGFPRSLALPAQCAQGAPCHESAPRGSRRGTQGMASYAERSKIPEALSVAVLEACLRDAQDGLSARVPRPVPAWWPRGGQHDLGLL